MSLSPDPVPRTTGLEGAAPGRPAEHDPRLDDPFEDVLAANQAYQRQFAERGLAALPGRARRGLGVLTCMDSRIDPLGMLGLQPGDAKIVRNAGARVSDDVLRTFTLATHLLDVRRIMVVAHTRCRMASTTQEAVVAEIASHGVDATSLEFGLIVDQLATLRTDVARIAHWPFLPDHVHVGGFLYDVDTGALTRAA
jgi:carbonic anhydrase